MEHTRFSNSSRRPVVRSSLTPVQVIQGNRTNDDSNELSLEDLQPSLIG